MKAVFSLVLITLVSAQVSAASHTIQFRGAVAIPPCEIVKHLFQRPHDNLKQLQKDIAQSASSNCAVPKLSLAKEPSATGKIEADNTKNIDVMVLTYL